MRIGLANERVVKAKLRELRAELARHMAPPQDAAASG